MNKVYKTVWNNSLGCWQVTSELTRSHSRGGQSSKATGHVKETKTWFQTLRLSLLSLALLPISLWAGASDVQLPTGGNVTVGSAQVSQNNNTLNVHQNSQNVGIQWDSFNIGQNATVNFYQPNTSSIAVNRVLDSNASQIMGKLNANGQVFLLNPNGVIFSKTAQVNVGGIVASTLNVTDSDIISGKFKLQNQVSGHDQNYDLIFTAGMLKIEAPLVDPKPPIVPEKPNQPDLSIWQELLGNPYQRAIHFAPQANKTKQSDSIEIEIIGDGINMDGIHTLTGNF